GRADLVLPGGDDGPGAAALLREQGGDLFGLGSREAVVAALGARPEQRAAYGAPVPAADLADLLTDLLSVPLTAQADPAVDVDAAVDRSGDEVIVTSDEPRALWAAEVAAWAHGFEVAGRERRRVRFRPLTP
ncbi:MAG: hypothetical protein WAV00_16885, partial [Nocardioides sp.]